MAAVAVSAPAHRPRAALVCSPLTTRCRVGGQHGEAARVESGDHAGGERQPDQALIHGRLRRSARTRSLSSCCDIAEVRLLTKVDVPSGRRNTYAAATAR